MKTLICDQSNGKHCRSLDRARRIAGATRGTATASYAKNDSYDITGISRISLRNEDLRKTHDIHKLCHSRTESRPGRCKTLSTAVVVAVVVATVGAKVVKLCTPHVF
jgi:hypothetical protein